MNTTLIVIPTFNEKENIARLIDEIKRQKVPADILVVDDNSPDGTGKIVQRISQKEKWVHILSRKKKEGLGRAYVAGFKWGLDHNYKKLISMDADFSHPVEALPRLIELCDSRTVVIGSRYIKGGKIVGWKWQRYINSWGANFVTRLLLHLGPKDATAGFKCYPREFLEKINLDKIQAAGYAFQVEMILLAQEANFKIVETPIVFTDRVAGRSKIQGELVKSAKIVFKLATQKKSYRQFVKFAIVGAINTGVDWAVFYPLKFLLSRSLPILSLQEAKQTAKAFSFIVSAASSYIMNRVWTFRSKDRKIIAQAGRFLIVAGSGLLLNSLIFYFVTATLHFRDIFGLVIATLIVFIWNFFINRNWTFKGKE